MGTSAQGEPQQYPGARAAAPSRTDRLKGAAAAAPGGAQGAARCISTNPQQSLRYLEKKLPPIGPLSAPILPPTGGGWYPGRRATAIGQDLAPRCCCCCCCWTPPALAHHLQAASPRVPGGTQHPRGAMPHFLDWFVPLYLMFSILILVGFGACIYYFEPGLQEAHKWRNQRPIVRRDLRKTMMVKDNLAFRVPDP